MKFVEIIDGDFAGMRARFLRDIPPEQAMNYELCEVLLTDGRTVEVEADYLRPVHAAGRVMAGRPRYETDDPLAIAVRDWRDARGLNVPEASDVLGVPQRTLEQIEQGGGFRYPALLLRALRCRDSDANRG